jgi:HEAT repeat protein
VTDAVARAAALAALGFSGPLGSAQLVELRGALRDDPDPRVRAAALGALVRGAAPDALSAWNDAVTDGGAAVRRRAAELAPALADPRAAPPLVGMLDDRDVTVVEAAAWALGELGADAVASDAVTALSTTARSHRDPLAREAAVAALGALADPAGLDAILHACNDRAAVKRRAVLALAPFSGPEVDAAIGAALDDRDWQVRQAAEDLDQS